MPITFVCPSADLCAITAVRCTNLNGIVYVSYFMTNISVSITPYPSPKKRLIVPSITQFWVAWVILLTQDSNLASRERGVRDCVQKLTSLQILL